ncbi:MAG: putative Dynein heavy chain [Streblomastix strix]|uniref:Putative Dynein heavy chain n=1 Tax=Streblomastix strix TaxID=222440 RepID=A0A5J4X138_9EUKA|nr:MAG: putative Dynein heavy chain [Streblomastix strix]
MLLRDALKKQVNSEIAEVNCSTQTSASILADSLKQHSMILSSAHGRTLRPKHGNKLILFLSDLQLPRADKYDTVEAVAFIHQLITYGGFYDIDLEWTIVEESILSPRFIANVRVVSIPHPLERSLQLVYTQFIEASIKHLKHKQLNSNVISSAMIDFYLKIQRSFTLQQHTHYCFTPRDLTRWVIGMSRYDINNQFIIKEANLDQKTLNASPDDQDTIGGQPPSQVHKRITMGITGLDQNNKYIQRQIQRYESAVRDINIILFNEFIDNYAKIDRLLAWPGQGIVLVGKCGVGRRTLLQLVSHSHGLRVMTPTSFEEIYNERIQIRKGSHNHFAVGVEKLRSANETVDVLSKEAEIQGKEVEGKQLECSSIMSKIQMKVLEVKDQRTEAETIEKELKKQQEEIKVQQNEIKEEMKDVQPQLDAAAKAVGNINKADLNELTSYTNPQQTIIVILGAVLCVLGTETTDFAVMKSFLKQPSAVTRISQYDFRDMNEQTKKKVEKLIQQNQEHFEKKKAYSVSKAVGPMSEWVTAGVKFFDVLKRVSPLEQRSKEIEIRKEEAQKRLVIVRKSLESFEVENKRLQTELNEKMNAAAVLQVRLSEMNNKREQASKLLGQLSDEKQRWEEQIQQMNAELARLPLQSLLSSAFHIYLSDETEDRRQTELQKWINQYIDFTDQKKELQNKQNINRLIWKSEGLPSDELSIENAIMIETAWKKQQGNDNNELIGNKSNKKNKKADISIDIIQQNDLKFLQKLELAVKWGKVLIVQEVDTIEPVLFPILRNELIKQGNRLVVTIGEKLVEVDEKFALFLITRNPQPSLGPDSRGVVSVISFTVTRAGLEAQLLSMTIQAEMPTLEQQRSELLSKEESLRIELSQLEKQLLNQLGRSEADAILEDKALISSLNETKRKSNNINEALKESSKLQNELQNKREAYKPLALLGADIYFQLETISGLNHMYQFSLSSFLNIFIRVLKQGEKSKEIEIRMKNMGKLLLHTTVVTVTRGMFKQDRLAFGLHLVHVLCPSAFGMNEWDLLLGRSTSISANQSEVPQWVGIEYKKQMAQLMGSVKDLSNNAGWNKQELAQKWTNWIKSSQCESEFPIQNPPQIISPMEEAISKARQEQIGNGQKIQKQQQSGLTHFQRVLLIQACRPDRLVSSLLSFVTTALNLPSLDPPPFSLPDVAQKECLPSQPILLVVTPGIDPTVELEEAAKRTVGSDKYSSVAMGQGQGEIALQIVRQFVNQEQWVCLKNVHLMPSWLNELEKLLASIGENGFNSKFRLFMTSEAQDHFPNVLLRSCLKISYEAPPGVKKNLARTFDSWREDGRFEGQNKNIDSIQKNNDNTNRASECIERPKILFALAWLHAVVQERRTYVPQGWIRAYEFSSADLRSAVDIVDNQLSAAVYASKTDDGIGKSRSQGKRMQVPWETIRALFAYTVYGGRIDNPMDWKVLNAYLRIWLNDRLITSNSLNILCEPLQQAQIPLQNRLIKPYIESLQLLPELDFPGLFCLPPNIEGTHQMAQGQDIIISIKRLGVGIQQQGNTIGGIEQWRAGLTPIVTMWKVLLDEANGGKSTTSNSCSILASNSILLKTPQSLKVIEQRKDEISPLDLFICIECRYSITLLSQIASDMNEIESLLSGQSVLTPTTSKVSEALSVDSIPSIWDPLWENGPSSASQFIRGAVQRAQNILKLVQRVSQNVSDIQQPFFGMFNSKFSSSDGNKKKNQSIRAGYSEVLKDAIDLGLLFRPEMLLNALRQQTARNLGCAMDELDLITHVVSPGKSDGIPRGWMMGACVPCRLQQLRLQGGQWKNNAVCWTDAGSASISLLDTHVMIAWIPQVALASNIQGSDSAKLFIPSQDTVQGKETFNFPVYMNEQRERLLMQMKLPVEQLQNKSGDGQGLISVEDQWVLGGSSILIS